MVFKYISNLSKIPKRLTKEKKEEFLKQLEDKKCFQNQMKWINLKK